MVWTIRDPKLRLCAAALFALWFAAIYGACDFVSYSLTPKHDVRIWLDDLIPFLPGFALCYLLINPLLMLTIFVVEETPELLAICLVLAIAVLIAGMIFITFPVVPLQAPVGDHGLLMRLSDWVNLRHNVLPSLHVTLSMITGLTCSPHLGKTARRILWIVVALIVLSTLFTRQHYIADVVAGIGLAYLCVWLFLNPARKLLAGKLNL